MHANLHIVGLLTIQFALASFLACACQKLRIPIILGYLFAGYLVGPYSPGFVADMKLAEQLAEIGVILMLFGVGLHFKIEDLNKVKAIAIPGAFFQTLMATCATVALTLALGWSLTSGIIMGLSIGVASTVILVRFLTEHRLLNSSKGHIAVGWLVVEDVFTVIILVLLPAFTAFSSQEKMAFDLLGSVALILGKFALLSVLIFTLGQRIVAFVLRAVARLSSPELFILTILAVVFLIATGSALIFGTSIALGAFLAGMVIGKTEVRHQAAAEALPLKDIFSVIFFLSVGMLFNPEVMVTQFKFFIGILFVILVVKPLAASAITYFFGYPLSTVLYVAICLAQIGEFSFILAEEALNLKLLPEEGFDILVACSFISISLNPLFFRLIPLLEAMWQKRWRTPVDFSFPSSLHQDKGQTAVIVGFGTIGKALKTFLTKRGIFVVVVEANIDRLAKESEGEVFFGDAENATILKQAGIEGASSLFITSPATDKNLKILKVAQKLNPEIAAVVRLDSLEGAPCVAKPNVAWVCIEERGAALFMEKAKQLLALDGGPIRPIG